ncbi:MAG: dipeptidase PepE [Flavobacteriales bacterium]|jgi:dipeptidase E|nr:MAG: dipeptidase PepE [Flavobacteriales bacterium]
MELLLLSNSTLPGEPFFTWPQPYAAAFLKNRRRIAFVPFAAPDAMLDAYADKVAQVFGGFGCELLSLHRESDPVAALNGADAVAVGGGNTFLLLRALYRSHLLKAIADRVRNGLPYIGWSAGSNVACPTIMTTNDMPIVEPPSLRAMHLVQFQINPHYTEATIPGHGGESRDQRIAEFLALNPRMTVAGLREGALLHVQGGTVRLEGSGMKVFRHGEPPLEVAGGTELRASLGGI